MLRTLLLSTAAVVLAGPVLASPLIDTFGAENSSVYSWGLPDTAAYGQTFTLGASETVNNFSFRINDGGSAIGYTAYVFAWDSGNAVTSGSALFSTSGTTSGNGLMQTYTINTGSLALGSGMYVAFLQASSGGAASWGSTTNDVYAGGSFVFQNNGGDSSQWGSSGWTTGWSTAADVSFAVNGVPAAVPVAPALPLLASGIGALAVLRRRRRAG